jgi:hypothetical protein
MKQNLLLDVIAAAAMLGAVIAGAALVMQLLRLWQ